MENETPAVPPHLADLIQPTPSGAAKLVAAWDGLSTENQIIVLKELKKCRPPAHLKARIATKALESSNAYVRYLAAIAVERLWFDEGEVCIPGNSATYSEGRRPGNPLESGHPIRGIRPGSRSEATLES